LPLSLTGLVAWLNGLIQHVLIVFREVTIMPIDYKRSITFTIPGNYYSPGVKISVTENNGVLDFTVNVLRQQAGIS